MNKVTNILKGRRFARDQASALIDITEEVMRSRPCVITVANGPQTWPAMPFAPTALFGATLLDWLVPLPDSATEVRLTASVLAAGPPNGTLSIWTTAGDPTVFAGYSMADAAIIPLDAVRFADSGWVTVPMLVSGGQRFAAVIGSDGDGIVDAEFSQLSIWTR
jgi:hypothetical protein